MIYTAKEIKHWEADCSVDGKVWLPARPVTLWSFERVKLAWLVLIGKLDALDWQESE